jgi:hypothetical protein
MLHSLIAGQEFLAGFFFAQLQLARSDAALAIPRAGCLTRPRTVLSKERE